MSNAFTPIVGDEVYLKSGSQRLTVESVDLEAQTIGVVWMKFAEHELRRDVLPIATVNFKIRGGDNKR